LAENRPLSVHRDPALIAKQPAAAFKEFAREQQHGPYRPDASRQHRSRCRFPDQSQCSALILDALYCVEPFDALSLPVPVAGVEWPGRRLFRSEFHRAAIDDEIVDDPPPQLERIKITPSANWAV